MPTHLTEEYLETGKVNYSVGEEKAAEAEAAAEAPVAAPKAEAPKAAEAPVAEAPKADLTQTAKEEEKA